MKTRGFFASILITKIVFGGMLAGCEKGPAQRAGERIDNAVDKLTGKGPVEKAGEQIDKAVQEITKK